MNDGERAPWWRGARGEWLVVAQIALMALVLFGPRRVGDTPAWPAAQARVWSVIGATLATLGAALFLAGVFRLGRGLTPLPYPKDGAALVQSGAYGIVRHPLYSGGLAIALGWALAVRGWLTLGYVLVLFALLDFKSRREERWLAAKHPEYAAYRQRVRKLIPFLY